MAKKLVELRQYVESSALNFCDYLDASVDGKVLKDLETVSHKSHTYIFSGVIRNFFLKKEGIRDIDVVLTDKIELENYFRKYNIKRNSFGGYKLSWDNISIDMWYLENTWAFQHQKTFPFELEKIMPSTSFFNFSSIVFSLSERKFYCTIHFLRFLRDKKIDFVYPPNANDRLCVVNTFYYSDNYFLNIAENLAKHLKYLHGKGAKDYESIQLKHFGSVLYSNDEIERRLRRL